MQRPNYNNYNYNQTNTNEYGLDKDKDKNKDKDKDVSDEAGREGQGQRLKNGTNIHVTNPLSSRMTKYHEHEIKQINEMNSRRKEDYLLYRRKEDESDYFSRESYVIGVALTFNWNSFSKHIHNNFKIPDPKYYASSDHSDKSDKKLSEKSNSNGDSSTDTNSKRTSGGVVGTARVSPENTTGTTGTTEPVNVTTQRHVRPSMHNNLAAMDLQGLRLASHASVSDVLDPEQLPHRRASRFNKSWISLREKPVLFSDEDRKNIYPFIDIDKDLLE